MVRTASVAAILVIGCASSPTPDRCVPLEGHPLPSPHEQGWWSSSSADGGVTATWCAQDRENLLKNTGVIIETREPSHPFAACSAVLPFYWGVMPYLRVAPEPHPVYHRDLSLDSFVPIFGTSEAGPAIPVSGPVVYFGEESGNVFVCHEGRWWWHGYH